MRPHRVKPYVCVDCDYAEHHRFQETKDVDAAAGTWLRCLAHSRAQEQDGLVKLAWLRRTFTETYSRVEELIAVGLLRPRPDGNYELHAYAPRNQTRAMIEEERAGARERMIAHRAARAELRGSVTANKRRTNTERTANKRRTSPNGVRNTVVSGPEDRVLASPIAPECAHSEETTCPLEVSLPLSPLPGPLPEVLNTAHDLESDIDGRASDAPCNDVTANERRTNAFVPISTTTTSLSSLPKDLEIHSRETPEENVRAVPRAPAPARAQREPLPPSERGMSGHLWLTAFSDGIAAQTGRPCSMGRVYLGTLERVVGHHAPERDVGRACAWIREEARAFAAQWDGKHPPKGLTPDGLERWLNEGRRSPPEFGKPRIVQLPAEEWHEDDWSDLGAKVLR